MLFNKLVKAIAGNSQKMPLPGTSTALLQSGLCAHPSAGERVLDRAVELCAASRSISYVAGHRQTRFCMLPWELAATRPQVQRLLSSSFKVDAAAHGVQREANDA